MAIDNRLPFLYCKGVMAAERGRQLQKLLSSLRRNSCDDFGLRPGTSHPIISDELKGLPPLAHAPIEKYSPDQLYDVQGRFHQDGTAKLSQWGPNGEFYPDGYPPKSS